MKNINIMIMIEIFDEDKKDITSSEKRKQKNLRDIQ